MSSQQVTDKILADAKEEAKEIFAKHEEEAKHIADEYAKRIAQKKAQNERKVEETVNTEIMRSISQKRLELNKKITEHKRERINTAIKKAIAKLVEHKDYVGFLKMLIESSDEKEGSLVLSKADAKRYRSDLEKYIQNTGSNLKVTVSDDLTGGIVITKEKSSYIGSLDIILELLSDELAIAVSKILY
ncbi:MAG: V-type ATP synthase subunit E [candidate division WOR-3 bacterium]|jgi:vacuolar-type H+-ATPase subunit E/Vma4